MGITRLMFDKASEMLAYLRTLDHQKFFVLARGEDGNRWYLDIQKKTPLFWF